MKLFDLYAELQLNIQAFKDGVQEGIKEANDLKASVEGVQETAEKTGSIMDTALGHALGDFMSDLTQMAIEAAFTFAKGGVQMASDMEEVQNVVDATFGNSAYKIDNWAKTTTQAYGIGELAALKYAGTMGATLQGMGVGEDQLYGMSTALVQLAGDMASFYNLDSATAFQKILSGITGETEPLKSLGIVMSAANLEAHALAMGLESSWKELDTATQAQVRYSYLMQATAAAQGDFTSTSGSYANQMRLLQENVAALQLTLGEDLLPVLTSMVTWFNSLFGGTDDAAKSVEALQEAYVGSYVSIENTTTKALALVNALEELSAAGEDASSTETWNAVMSKLKETLPGIAELIDENTGSIEGGTTALKAYVAQWRETQREMNRMNFLKGKLELFDQMEAQVAALQADQYVADQLKAGAASEKNELANQLLATIIAGMDAVGSSEADVKAMEKFAAQGGVENLLARIAGGGNAGTIMSALLQGGDLWKNKSFMQYYTAGGGSMEQLEWMAELYEGYQKTFDTYTKDNSAQIAERKAAMDMLENEINVMADYLDKVDADRAAAATAAPAPEQPQPPAQPMQSTIIIYATIDGKQVAAEVSADVLSEIEWEIQKHTGGS